MSNLTKFLEEAVTKTKFKLTPSSNGAYLLECEDIAMFWTNFAGKPNKFNNTAKVFNMAVTDEVISWFNQVGLAVRIHEVGGKTNEETGETEPLIKYINVKVQMSGQYPPEVVIFSYLNGQKDKQTPLNEDTISCLDHCKMIGADCMIRISESKASPGHYVCYLKKLYVRKETVVEFSGKYDDWMNETTPMPVAPDDDGNED